MWALLKNPQSIISRPTFIRIPASNAVGICSAKGPAPTKTINNTTEWTIPEMGVDPPDLTFITVLMVAPAPGKPENRPATAFPIPWPISSLSELCFVWEILSATRDVSKESIAPSTARTNPALKIIGKYWLKLGKFKDGTPLGISPILSIAPSPKINIDIGVTINKANRGEGTHWLIFLGVRNTIPRVIIATPIAAPFGWKFENTVVKDSTTPPRVLMPSNGPIWRAMIITPIPDINPETTEYGTKVMYLPSFRIPNNICSKPPMTTAAITKGKICPAERSLGTPTAAKPATTPATVTLMGPVGPLTWAGVPPNNAAKKPTTTAPYSP